MSTRPQPASYVPLSVHPERYRTILLFGAPGSGKGTQGKALGSVPRFYHCACGDVFRSLDTRTRLGQEFLEYSSRGELVPAEITVELWQVQIEHQVESHRFKPDLDFLVLDGIPRTVEQARAMKPHIEVKKVFHLTCPRPQAARRSAQEARPQGQPPGRRERIRHPQSPGNLRRGEQARPGLLRPGPRPDHRRHANPGQSIAGNPPDRHGFVKSEVGSRK